MVALRERKQRKNQTGSPSPKGEPSFLAVARVRRPFGVRGQLLLEVLTEFPQRMLQAKTIFIGEEHRAVAVASIRRHGDDFVIALEGVADREPAENLRGQILYMRFDDMPPLPEGTYYLHQVEGLTVATESGEILGTVREILKTGANDVYVVRGERGELLLPAIQPVILSVQLETKTMVVRLLDGLEWGKSPSPKGSRNG
jgi:16S rRNA processing protein RimM